MKKILLVRFSSIGDIVLTTPLIRVLKSRLPDSKIDFFTKSVFAPLLQGNPNLDRIIELPNKSGFSQIRRIIRDMKQSGGYDAVFDLQGTPRSRYVALSGVGKITGRAKKNRIKRLLLVNAGINLYGPDPAPMPERYFTAFDGLFEPQIEPDGKGAEIFIDEKDRQEARGALKETNNYFVIAPSARWPTKRWMPDSFAEAGDKIAEKSGAAAVIVGAAEDRELASYIAGKMKKTPIDLTGRLSIMGTAAALKGAKAFIGNDTGLMHIAGTLEVPGVVVFGPTTRHLGFFPFQSNIIAVENNSIGCRPCTNQGHTECPRRHFLCMRSVSEDEVIQTVIDALAA